MATKKTATKKKAATKKPAVKKAATKKPAVKKTATKKTATKKKAATATKTPATGSVAAPRALFVTGDDGVCRCAWGGVDDVLMRRYHDTEWGVPERDGRKLWAKLMLDGFQAGLSWRTILHRRDGFAKAFANWDPEVVARFDDDDVERLMNDAGIIRARAKIEATIKGARAYLQFKERGEDFGEFCWAFVDGAPVMGSGTHFPATTPLSETISKALKQRGFSFVGPTIVYAWMQATGLVNDHHERCFRRVQIASSSSPSPSTKETK